jgi:hypothetical protein
VFEEEIEKFHGECMGTRLGFISYSELADLYTTAIRFLALRNRLLDKDSGGNLKTRTEDTLEGK